MKTRIALVAALALTACSGADISIDGAWARTSPMMADAGAAYMTISSPDADRLIAVAVDASVAATAEIHETVMTPGDMGDESMTDESMADHSEAAMTMQEVAAIELAAGQDVVLEPGGYHIMLIDLASPLETGQSFDLTLTFENAGQKTATVEVRDDAP